MGIRLLSLVLAAFALSQPVYSGGKANGGKMSAKELAEFRDGFVPDSEQKKIPDSEFKDKDYAFYAWQKDIWFKKEIGRMVTLKNLNPRERSELDAAKNDPYKWVGTFQTQMLARIFDLEKVVGILRERREAENPYRKTPTDKAIENATARWREVKGFEAIADRFVKAMDLKRKYGVLERLPANAEDAGDKN